MIEADGVIHHPMQGIRIWKNRANKFLVFEAHYTADPNKRSEEFRKEKQASLPRRKFLMEYEIHWESFSGLPVYGDTWNSKVHTTEKIIDPELGLPLLLGFDWGLTPACVVAQLVGSELRCLKEFVAINMGAERFVSLVGRELRLLYPNWGNFEKDFIVAIDPSGQFRKDTDESTCADILVKKGFKQLYPGAIPFERRRSGVEQYLQRMHGGSPCFVVSKSTCPMLVKGFDGGYMFAEGQDEIEPHALKPVKNEYSHCFRGDTKVQTIHGPKEIKNIIVGDLVETDLGLRKVLRSWKSGSDSKIIRLRFTNGAELFCTEEHLVYTENRGYVMAKDLNRGDIFQELKTRSINIKWLNLRDKLFLNLSGLTRKSFLGIPPITKPGLGAKRNPQIFTELFGQRLMEKFRSVITFIIETATLSTTRSATSSSSVGTTITRSTCESGRENRSLKPSDPLKKKQRYGTAQTKGEPGTSYIAEIFGKKENPSLSPASFVRRSLKQKHSTRGFVTLTAATNLFIGRGCKPKLLDKTELGVADVYDLTVEGAHCFYAEGILVHNCHDALQMICTVIDQIQTGIRAKVPIPKYSWMR